MASKQIPAVVAYPPDGKPNFKYEQITISRELQDHEIQVGMVATGICHTDLFFASLPQGAMGVTYPKVYGHEGAGYVEAVGPGVTNLEVGDPVLLSYNYCQKCDLCEKGQESYCIDWNLLNVGLSPTFKIQSGEEATGKFFGQSSFASSSIVQDVSVVNVKGLVEGKDDLKLLAPLGCGLLTGAGALVNSAKATATDIVLVTGIGAVGCGAIMAAKIAGCKAVIAVDRVASRLALAKDLGATHTLDTSTLTNPSDANEMASAIQALLGPVPTDPTQHGPRITAAFETTGSPLVITASILALGKKGKLIQIGIPPPDSAISVPMAQFYYEQKEWEAHFLGNTTAKVMVPKMIKWWKEGKFPVEKLVKYFPANEAVEAIEGMESGKVVKPVLVW